MVLHYNSHSFSIHNTQCSMEINFLQGHSARSSTLNEHILVFQQVNLDLVEVALMTLISPVIRQKGESQKACFKKTKHAKFPEKQTFVCFLGNLASFVFLNHLFWDSFFWLITGDLSFSYKHKIFTKID